MRKVVLVGALAVIAGLIGLWLWIPEQNPSREKLNNRYAEKEAKPEYPGEAAAYLASHRQTPHGENPAVLNHQARMAIEARREIEGMDPVANFKFEEWGPGNFAGRSRAIVAHPNNADHLLFSGVDGGFWKSTDGGATWQPVNDFLPNLAIGSMIVDPDNPDRVFAGTGEGFFNVDAARGLGIFQSDDFGDTWTQLAATNNANFHYVNRLGRIPGTNILLAATRAGIYRSTDLGLTWNEVSGVAVSSRGFVDLKVDPSDTSRVYVYHYGSTSSRFIMRSNDQGASFTQLGAAEGLPTTNIGRMELGIGSDGVIYAAVANSSSSTRGLWRSPAGGNAFAQTASNTPFIERQGWYDLICGVDPSDSDRVYLGAVDVFRTTDAGTTITKQTFWNPGAGQIPQYVHADIHNIAFHPTNTDIHWIGCDGGIFKTTDGGNTYESLNNDIRVTQYYGIAAHPTDITQVIGGTQDNGTHLFFGDHVVWLQWFGGDGGFCAWDQQQPNFIYGSLPGGGLFGSNDGGLTSTQISLPDTTGALFIEPFTIDPSDGNRMILGTDNIFFSQNIRNLGGSTWVDASGPLGGSVSATTISPHNGQVAYAGTSSGNVWVSTNLGAGNTFTQIDDAGMPGASVTWIEVDPHDPSSNTAYVTFSSYGPDRVWKTTDGGATWASIHGDLPDIPMWAITVDPTDPNRLFLGSELGLFTTDGNNRGAFQWSQYDYGPAWARVIQMRWTGDDTLWLGTHGRSIYRASRNPADISLGTIVGTDCDDEDAYPDLMEVFEIPVTVTNNGGRNLVNVSVALASVYVGFNINNSPLNFGTIAPGGFETQNFQADLSLLGNCLDMAQLTVTVTHDDGTVQQNFLQTLGANPNFQSGTLTEDAEGASLFTHEAQLNTDDWAQVSTQAHTGTQSWFAADVVNYADKSLISPWVTADAGGNVISFWLYYDMEGDASQYWDGAVLEMRTEGGDWFDIGNMSTLPYDGQLFNNTTLERRLAWSGVQTTWRQGTVDLGATYVGQNIQFRFRVACDTASANVGFWVDDISITNVTWLANLDCDTEECLACFANIGDAINEMLQSLGNGEWPVQQTVLDYVSDLNNICVE